MMGWYLSQLKQSAVYWPPATNPAGVLLIDASGKPSLGPPIQIACRWEDENSVQKQTDAMPFTGTAEIFVDRVLLMRGYIWQGTLDDAPVDPSRIDPVTGNVAYEIKKFVETPAFGVDQFQYIAYV